MNHLTRESVEVLWKHSSLPQFAHTSPRYAIGISYTHGNSFLNATLIRALGRGIHLVCDVIEQREVELNDDANSALNHETPTSINLGHLTQLKADLAEFCANLTRPLIAHSKRNYDEVLVIGLNNVGIWIRDRVSGSQFEPLCDSSILAEATGISVVDDFPARDLAHSGLGGPTNVLSDWILIGDRSGIPGIRNRAILRLDDTFRLNVIPNRQTHELPSNYVAIDINPGENLIKAVKDHFKISNQHYIAPTFSVQGRVLADLFDEWLKIPNDKGVWSHDQKLDARYRDALLRHSQSGNAQNGEKGDANFQDVMATTIRFLGRNTIAKIDASIPDSMPISELILAGSLQLDGAFVGQLCERLGCRVLPLPHLLGMKELDSPSAAIMALARIDQLIGNAYRSSKTKVPRCLGRITPGNPKNWEKVTLELYAQLTSTLKLKEAV